MTRRHVHVDAEAVALGLGAMGLLSVVILPAEALSSLLAAGFAIAALAVLRLAGRSIGE